MSFRSSLHRSGSPLETVAAHSSLLLPWLLNFYAAVSIRVTLHYIRGCFLNRLILLPVVPVEGRNYSLVCLVSLRYRGWRLAGCQDSASQAQWLQCVQKEGKKIPCCLLLWRSSRWRSNEEFYLVNQTELHRLPLKIQSQLWKLTEAPPTRPSPNHKPSPQLLHHQLVASSGPPQTHPRQIWASYPMRKGVILTLPSALCITLTLMPYN